MPDEETQFPAYDAVLRWAGNRPVTIRTFDAGGDKPVPGFTDDGEANPFLGVRGLRLCLARPDVFTVQLRALARAARPRKSQSHVSDGDDAGGAGGRPQACSSKRSHR